MLPMLLTMGPLNLSRPNYHQGLGDIIRRGSFGGFDYIQAISQISYDLVTARPQQIS